MIDGYLGHLSRRDPLYAYIQVHIAPQLGFYSPDAVYRVFKFSNSRAVYLYEERHSGVRIVSKFHQNHPPGSSLFPRKTGEKGQEAFFFSIAVAVGLTPEMLPMIVSVCLSKGALAMSKKKVIVKQLNAIQNFGAMDVLCTDKTGTLTMDRVILERHCDVMQKENDAFLPFMPMAPIQVLTNNLLYDFSQVPIPTDTVGPEQTARPRPWHIGDIKKFVLFIGPVSSIFDYTTFFVMLYVFGCWDPARAALFQTGWFVESLITQTLIVHVIRTNKMPFIHGRASWQLTLTTGAIMAVAAWLPYSPAGPALGFRALPPLYWPILLATLLCYVVLTQFVKMWLIRKTWL